MTDSHTYSSRPTPSRTHSKDISTSTAFYSSSTSRPIHPPPSTPSGCGGYGHYALASVRNARSSEIKDIAGKIESPRKASKSKLDELVGLQSHASSFRGSDRHQIVEGTTQAATEDLHSVNENASPSTFRRSPNKTNRKSISPVKGIHTSDYERQDSTTGRKSTEERMEMNSRSPRKASSNNHRNERKVDEDRIGQPAIGIAHGLGDESMLINHPRYDLHNVRSQHQLIADDGMDYLGTSDSSFAEMIAKPAARRAGSIKSRSNPANPTTNYEISHHDDQNADESIMWDLNLDKRDSSPAKRLSAFLPRSPSSRSLAQTLVGDDNVNVQPLRFSTAPGSPSRFKERIDSGVGDGSKIGMSRWEEEQMMARRRVEEMMRVQENAKPSEEDVFGVSRTPVRSGGRIVRSSSRRSIGDRSGPREASEFSPSSSRSRERLPQTSSHHYNDAESPRKPLSPRKSRDVDGRHVESRSPSKDNSQSERLIDRVRSPRHATDVDRWVSTGETSPQATPRDQSYNLDRSTLLPASPSIRRNMATAAGRQNLRDERIDVLHGTTLAPLVDPILHRSTILPASPSITRNIGMLTAQTDLREERLDDVDLAALDESMLLTSPPGSALGFHGQPSVRSPLKHQEVKGEYRTSPVKPERSARTPLSSPRKSERARASRPLPVLPGSEYGGNDDTIILGMRSPTRGDETFFDLLATEDLSMEMLKGMGDADESIMDNVACLNRINLPKPKVPIDTPRRSKQSINRILPIELTSSPMRQASVKVSLNVPVIATPRRGASGRAVLDMYDTTPRITETPGTGTESDSDDDEYLKHVFKPRSSKSVVDAFKSGAFASPAPPQSSKRENTRMLDDIVALSTPHGMNSLRDKRAALGPPMSMHRPGKEPSSSRTSVLTPSGPSRTNPPESSRKPVSTRTITLPKPRSGEVQGSDGPAKVSSLSSGAVQRINTHVQAKSSSSVGHQPRLPATRPSNAAVTRPIASSGRPLPTVPVTRGVSSSSGIRSKKEGISPNKILARPPTSRPFASIATLPRGVGRVPSTSTSAGSRPLRPASSQPTTTTTTTTTTLRPSTSSTTTCRIPGPSKTSIPSRIPSGSRTSVAVPLPQPVGNRIASASLASKSKQGLPRPGVEVSGQRFASRVSGRPLVAPSGSSVMAFAEQVLAGGKNRRMAASGSAR